MNGAADGVSGKRASEIGDSIESAIREGRLLPGDQLPTVRALADRLDVSPSTISAAYRFLRQRGVISTHGRGGTKVHSRPPVEARRDAVNTMSARVGWAKSLLAAVDSENGLHNTGCTVWPATQKGGGVSV